MTLLQAFLLGIIQGITEFFPVSSSTHLFIAKSLMGISSGESTFFFDLLCHLGTFTAALYVFRKDIYVLFTTRRDKLWQIVLALTPLIPALFLFKPLRALFHGYFWLGMSLMITAVFLFIGERFRVKGMPSISRWRRSRDALLIGAFQSAALIPGISRSASTIASAKYLGWNGGEAIRFSFLLAIPTIFGGCILELWSMISSHGIDLAWPISPSCCLMGFGTSAVTALIIIGPAVRLLEKEGLRPFGWYCLVLSICLMLSALQGS